MDTEKFIRDADKIKFSRGKFLRTLAVLSGSLAFLGSTEDAYAHPPSDIEITFDNSSKTLKAVIMHKVSNPKIHYIKRADVALNGKKIIAHKISEQDNHATQTVAYLIPDAKPEDTLSVEAYCSISGKLKKEMTLS